MILDEPTRIPLETIANSSRTPLRLLSLALALIFAQSALRSLVYGISAMHR